MAGYSLEQKIGDLGAKAFEAGRPDSWVKESEPRQGGDFGFDYSMHFEEGGQILGRFSVQVKSGLQIAPKGESAAQYFSVKIERATCNRYLQDGQPVLLVFASLADLSSRRATLHYLWIEDQIKERLNGKLRFNEEDVAEPTFRVPVSNVLTHSTDITEHLREHWDFNLKSHQLRGMPDGIPLMENLSKLSPAGIAGLTRTNPVSLDVWVRNESLSGNRPWATPTPNSPAGRLKQVSEDISAGKLADAERELGNLAADDGLSGELRAEIQFQIGRLKTVVGTPNEAFEHYRTAAALQPKNTLYVAAKIEMAVSSRADDEPIDLSFVASIDSEVANDQGVLFQLVRVAKINEDHALAAQLLERLEEPERSKAVALQALIEGDWPTVIAVADTQAPIQPNATDRFFLNLLRHRAELHTLLRGAESYSIGGPIDIDIELAKSFRDLTLSLLHEAKSRHWPPNSTLLLDGANVVASVFGASGEIADLIKEFAAARPYNQGAQEAAARTAALGDRPDDVIAALERMGADKGDDSARLVLVLCESGRHLDGARKAFGLIDKWEYTELTSAAAAISSLSARRVGLVAEAKALDAFLAKSSDYPGVKLLAEFVRRIHESPEDAESHVQNLLTACDEEPLLQDNLMLHLSANRVDNSQSIVDVCSKIMLRRGLAEMEHTKYLAALYTLGRHDDVIAASKVAIARFPANETIALCRALSLDLRGQVQAADLTLRRIASPARLDLLDTHSRLLMRLGEQDAAVSLVHRALERAQRVDRFQLLQLLSLLQSQNQPEEYLETVWQLGQAADRGDEDQEAIFLISFAIASGRVQDVPIAWQAEFHERSERSSASYPDSKAFRIGRFDAENGASAIQELHRLSGETEQTQNTRSRQRRLGEAMGSNVPYSYRPRRFAPLARNVVDLAAFTMHGPDTPEWARLAFHSDSGSEGPRSAPPIVDLITFLALVELDLLEAAIKVWSCIAIPKISAFILAAMKFEPIAPGNNELLDKAMNALRTHRGAIIQPTISGHTGAPQPRTSTT
jgi:tetratricopeptide (TPR) repeat protein